VPKYSYYAEVGLPPGPLAEPVTLWRVGHGKLHLTSSCRDRLEPVQVILWETETDDYCSKCGGRQAWLPEHIVSRLNQMSSLLRRIRAVEDALALDVEHGHFSQFVHIGAQSLQQLSTLPGNASSGVTDPDLLQWVDDTLRPRLQLCLDIARTQVPFLTTDDWDVRYAVALLFKRSIDDLPPKRRERDHQVVGKNAYQDVVEGIREAWFRSASTPSRAQLAQAGLGAVTAKSLAAVSLTSLDQLKVDPMEEAPPLLANELLADYLQRLLARSMDSELTHIAYSLADQLLDRYATATAEADVLVRWEAPLDYTEWASRSPLVGALLGAGSFYQYIPDYEAALVAVPPAVASALRPPGTYSRFKTDNTTTLLTFGPVEPHDSHEMFAMAHRLSVGEDPYEAPAALEIARLTHVQAA
jgi:hypothetical protein